MRTSQRRAIYMASQEQRTKPQATAPDLPGVPEFGDVAVIEPGLMTARLPHPAPPSEVNVYFIEGDDGWTILDTGMGEESMAAWETMFAGPLRGLKFSRVMVSHFHSDHIGLAGWLSQRLDVPVWMTRQCRESFEFDTRPYDAGQRKSVNDFCAMHGFDEGVRERLLQQPAEFYEGCFPLPENMVELPLSGELSFARHNFEIMPVSGHAPDLVTLRETSGRLYLSCDQVMGALSAVLFVNVVEPDYNSAARYLESLDLIEATVPDDALVLPGHFGPFTGLHACVRKARERQNARAERVLNACREGEKQLVDITTVLYGRPPVGREAWFYVSEALTNVNRLIGEGRLVWRERGGSRILAAV